MGGVQARKGIIFLSHIEINTQQSRHAAAIQTGSSPACFAALYLQESRGGGGMVVVF